MVSTDAICTVAGIIGNVISLTLFLSPIPTFYSIHKKDAVEADISPYPYLMAVFNCASWVCYGLVKPNSLLFVTMNGIGLAIEFIYVALYLFYASKEQTLCALKNTIFAFALYLVELLFMTAIYLDSMPWRDAGIASLGFVCVNGNFSRILPYTDMLLKVRQTKSLEHISFWLSLFGFLNAACWLTYGLLRLDTYILTMSIMNCAFGVVQLSVYAYYYFRYPQQSKSNKIHDENPNANAAGGELQQLPDAGQINN
ncbi:hypothetical protein MKW94_020930 [Papaver nudicaule]|uniref:Bidirectional sugar transporter SWEET n=1 Tax=Papaver nudicaule TaxID=74823 RepID=A0AA41UW06_PAPNU|nr:hypothetical protein [Papaver nudicaule]